MASTVYEKEMRCAAILVNCSVRDWTWCYYVIGFGNNRTRRRQLIKFVGDLFFPTLDSVKKNIPIYCRIRRMRVDGTEPYPERKYCRFRNIQIRVNGAFIIPRIRTWLIAITQIKATMLEGVHELPTGI